MIEKIIIPLSVEPDIEFKISTRKSYHSYRLFPEEFRILIFE